MSAADNETAATEAEAPVLLPEDLSGPDAGGDPAAGSAPADGPESQPEAAEAPQETPEPAAEAEPQPAPEPAPRVSLRELEARIDAKLQHAAGAASWPDLWAKFDAAEQDNARGDNEDGRLLNAWCEQAWTATFPPRRSAVAEVMAAAGTS